MIRQHSEAASHACIRKCARRLIDITERVLNHCRGELLNTYDLHIYVSEKMVASEKREIHLRSLFAAKPTNLNVSDDCRRSVVNEQRADSMITSPFSAQRTYRAPLTLEKTCRPFGDHPCRSMGGIGMPLVRLRGHPKINNSLGHDKVGHRPSLSTSTLSPQRASPCPTQWFFHRVL